MIDQVIKRLVIVICILSLLFIPIVKADSSKASENETKLAKTIEAFFTDWLIRRDAQTAMKYVSSKAILCNKELPDELQSKGKLSQEDVNRIFEQVFSRTLEYLHPSDKLEASISSSYGFIEKSDSVISIEHTKRDLFELFRLNITEGKTAQDFAFICKFDETPVFREAVGKPDSYYVMTNMQFLPDIISKAFPDNKFPFQMVWVKEASDWRILTIGAIED